MYHKVAVTVAVALDRRHTLAAQANHLAGLCARLYLYLDTSVQCRNLHRAAQCCRREVQEQVVDEVLFLADELLVRFHLNIDLYVTRHTIAPSGIALSGHVDYHAVIYACGDVHLHGLLTLYHAFATTVRTLVLDDSAFTVAVGTGRLGLHASEHTVHHLGHHARTATLRTAFRLAVLAAAAVAMVAVHHLLYVELLRSSLGRLFQREAYLQAQVLAARLLLGCPTASETTETAEATEAPGMSAKDVTEGREDILHVHASVTTASSSEASVAIQSGMSELVITLTLLVVAQYAVCLGGLLELLLRLLVAGVVVRVVFEGHLAVSLLYVLLRCAFLDAQHFVIITFCHLLPDCLGGF